jgi:hypothetical protein
MWGKKREKKEEKRDGWITKNKKEVRFLKIDGNIRKIFNFVLCDKPK